MIMSRFSIIFFSFVLFSGNVLLAQQQQLSIEDAVYGIYTKLAPDRINQLQWRPGYDQYSFVKNNALHLYDITTSLETEPVNTDSLNTKIIPLRDDSLKSFPAMTWIDTERFSFSTSKAMYVYNLKSNSLEKSFTFSETAENFDFSPDCRFLAYTTGTNLNIVGTDHAEINVTNDRDLNIVYGATVHRNEFGIEKGTYWSPSGKYLAFYRNDESHVTSYPLVDISQRIATVDSIKYPMAGMDSEEVELAIYNTQSQKTIRIETGKPVDQYLTNIAWHPDEKIIYIAVLNREQNHMKLNAYNIESGKFVKTLFEEKNDNYVEPLHPIMFLPDSKTFIWQSRRDGFNHLYLYDDSGKLLKQLTTGQWEVNEVYGLNSNGKLLFFKANKENPINFDIYCLDMESGKIQRLSKTPGNHNAIVQFDGTHVIDVYSSTETPACYEIIDFNGQKIKTLLTAENPLKNYRLGNMRIGSIKAADNKTDLYYRIILPPDFDKSKKYPCIVYVYGGPHSQLVSNRWMGGAAGWDYYMAQNGYIMFTLDNRGTANRGLQFENVIHRNLGVAETEDQMLGIEYLRSLKYVDMERIGVHGWSYGGFMTITMMTSHPEIFKVGVAGGPVIDWKYYEVMYGERYMDTPDENSLGYQTTSLLNKAGKLQGRLLIIHGAIDNTVVWQHSLTFIQECIKNKVLVDYFVYPRHEHNVRGYDRIHLMRMVTRYFDDNLKANY